jgi:hypothetical protein
LAQFLNAFFSKAQTFAEKIFQSLLVFCENCQRSAVLTDVLGRRLERMQSRATVECLMNGRAEVAQAVVTHVKGGFCDVGFAIAKEFGCLYHA